MFFFSRLIENWFDVYLVRSVDVCIKDLATTPELRSKKGYSHCGLIITTFKHFSLFKIMIEWERCRDVIRWARRRLLIVAVVFANFALPSGGIGITVTTIFVQLDRFEIDAVFNVSFSFSFCFFVVWLFVIIVLVGNVRQTGTLHRRTKAHNRTEKVRFVYHGKSGRGFRGSDRSRYRWSRRTVRRTIGTKRGHVVVSAGRGWWWR